MNRDRPARTELLAFERLVLAEAGVHQPPTVQDIFAALEVHVFVGDQRANDGSNITRRLTMAQFPKIAPRAAPEIVARAIAEERAFPGRRLGTTIRSPVAGFRPTTPPSGLSTSRGVTRTSSW
jgi:hypothetical protein